MEVLITEAAYKEALKEIEHAEQVINEYHAQQRREIERKLTENKPFTDKELRYSATELCLCGRGLAYPIGCSPCHYWTCAGVLTGTYDPHGTHTLKVPFTLSSILSEIQPSAGGRTTRGAYPHQTDVLADDWMVRE